MIGTPCYPIIDFWDMVEWMEPSSSLQSTWNFFYKIINFFSKAPHLIKFLSNAICYSNLKTFHTCNLLSHWALSNCCDSLWDTFHIPMIKITYTSPLTCYTSTLEDSEHFHPPQNKSPSHTMILSLQSYHQGCGLYKKK